MRIPKQLLAVYLLATACGRADPPIITDYSNGHLSFSNSMGTGYHSIEWASSLTGEWSRTWQLLSDMPATPGESRIEVPMYYRVVWHTNASTIGGSSPVERSYSQIGGVGRTGLHAYSGVLAKVPVVAGSLRIDCGSFHFDDNGSTVLVGSIAGTSGSINYTTGNWTVSLGALEFGAGIEISANWRYAEVVDWVINWQILGSGIAGVHAYSGVLAKVPVMGGSLSIDCGAFHFADDGAGVLAGNIAGTSGALDYTTGNWTLNLGTVEFPVGVEIHANWRYALPESPSGVEKDYSQIVGTGIVGLHAYSGVLAKVPIVPGSVTIDCGAFHFGDNGSTVLVGSIAGTGGSINYTTGNWTFNLGALEYGPGVEISANWRYLQ